MNRSRVLPAVTLFLVVVGCLGRLSAQDPTAIGAMPSILTWQQDIGVPDECAGCSYRTGENLEENVITYSSIVGSNFHFGELCSYQVDGQVYAQPLVVRNVKWNNTGTAQTVAYVVTQADTIYAFDTSCNFLGKLPFLNTPTMSGQTAANCGNLAPGNCGTINPTIGILGTPVININSNGTGTIYLVTESESSDGVTFYHYLHAVDAATLAEASVSPVLVTDGTSKFSFKHIQRPGLLYGDGYVYVGFSMMDGLRNPLPNGQIFSFNATTLAAAGSFATSAGTTGQDGGGIWQDGAGLAYAWANSTERTRYIYFNTGNGVYDADQSSPPNTDYGDSFLKIKQLSTTTIGPASSTLANYSFTPADSYYRDNTCNVIGANAGDWDLDSGGVMLIPGQYNARSCGRFLPRVCSHLHEDRQGTRLAPGDAGSI